MAGIATFVGRLMLALIFIVAGFGKFADIPGTSAYIMSVGLPSGLTVPTAIFEIVAGFAIALGFMTRFFSVILAGFCLVTAFFFHNQINDPSQAAMAMKNIAIAGGFLCLYASSHLRWSFDAMRAGRARNHAEAPY